MIGQPVLVLGATGRIGRVLRQCWAGQGDILWQSRRPQEGAGWAVVSPLDDPGALRDAASGRQILCLAGSVPSRGGPMDDNIRLVEAALQSADPGARVLLTSSAAVYGAGSGPLPETSALAPANGYGRAKAAREAAAARLAAARGVRACALRIGNIAGLDAALGGWHPGFRLDSFPDGATPRRSYIGLCTLARVLAALLNAPELPPVLNVAAPGTIEMGELLNAAGCECRLRPAPQEAIARVELDVRLLTALLPEGLLSAADAAAMVREWSSLEPVLS